MTASNEPADSVRTCTASGSRDPRTGSDNPLGLRVSNPQSARSIALDARAGGGERRFHLARVPIALIADDEESSGRRPPLAAVSGERGIEQFVMHARRRENSLRFRSR